MITKSLPKARNSLELRDKLYLKMKREEPFSRLREIIASFPCVWFRLKITSKPSGKSTVLSKRIRKLPLGQVVGRVERSNSWRKNYLAGLYMRTLNF